MSMRIRTEIFNGKKRIILNAKASGVDRVGEAMAEVLGQDFKYKEELQCQSHLEERMTSKKAE